MTPLAYLQKSENHTNRWVSLQGNTSFAQKSSFYMVSPESPSVLEAMQATQGCLRPNRTLKVGEINPHSQKPNWNANGLCTHAQIHPSFSYALCASLRL